jgi:tol-pal system protein YbgF
MSMQRSAAAALAALALAAAGSARAALFEDDEARKAILDLRAKVAQIEEQHKARLAELGVANSQLLEQLVALRRSLLDLNNQLEAMRGEQAALRGSNEQLARDVLELQRRQKDVGQALDDRLRRLEPVKVSLDGDEFLADPDEKRQHDDALAVLKNGDFDRAAIQLAAFLRRYPASGYAPSARFWLGNAQYARRDYKEAISTFRAFVASSPSHQRAPEALLALANSQAEMKDPRSARRTIEELVKAYPNSEAAAAGKERLASLR